MRTILLTLLVVAPLTAGATKLDSNICASLGVGGTANYAAGFPAWNVGNPGRPMLRRTLTGASARCNDGSPAIMYVRPAPAGGQSDKWVIHLGGGGGCTSSQACLERWCGVTANSYDNAARMSSLGAPLSRAEQGGILNEVAGGPFSGYNHVFVPYCSSDNWAGSASIGEPIDPATAAAPGYDIEFQGEAIVADVIGTLRANTGTPVDPLAAASFFPYLMPDLDAATRVIISGDSAGGGGARHHIDGIRGTLVSVPEVYLVVDAGYSAPFYRLTAAHWAATPYVDYMDMMTTLRSPIMRDFWSVGDSALDQSCLTASVDPLLRCLDTDWTLKHHITTPFFVHQDLTDPVTAPSWPIFATSYDYANFNFAALNDLLTPGTEARTLPAGTLGLNCGNHTASRNTHKFTNWTVSNPPGPNLGFQALVDQWLGGAASVSIQTDNTVAAGYSASNCPP